MAYQCAAGAEKRGEKAAANAPTPSARPTHAANASQFGREFRPR